MTQLLVGLGIACLIVLGWKIVTMDDDWDTGDMLSSEEYSRRYWLEKGR